MIMLRVAATPVYEQSVLDITATASDIPAPSRLCHVSSARPAQPWLSVTSDSCECSRVLSGEPVLYEAFRRGTIISPTRRCARERADARAFHEVRAAGGQGQGTAARLRTADMPIAAPSHAFIARDCFIALSCHSFYDIDARTCCRYRCAYSLVIIASRLSQPRAHIEYAGVTLPVRQVEYCLHAPYA